MSTTFLAQVTMNQFLIAIAFNMLTNLPLAALIYLAIRLALKHGDIYLPQRTKGYAAGSGLVNRKTAAEIE